jgi:hypothetical protein
MAVWFRMTSAVVEASSRRPCSGWRRRPTRATASAWPDLSRYTFVNADLTIALLRRPVGEWFALDARTLAADEGLGLADTRYWDEHGAHGRGVQALLVEPRTGAMT